MISGMLVKALAQLWRDGYNLRDPGIAARHAKGRTDAIGPGFREDGNGFLQRSLEL